jgi:hypothetical protein
MKRRLIIRRRPTFAQKQRLRRIERARKNNVKNKRRIRLEGDWE